MKTLRTSFIALAVSIVALSLPVPAGAQNLKFDAFFVFSDSLGDTGNDLILTRTAGLYPAIPPSESPHKTYFKGRFSNGPILFEHFWALLSASHDSVTPSLAVAEVPRKGAISFAYGGSTSGADCSPFPGLGCQVTQFAALLGGNPPPPRALYAVFSGANDIFGATNPLDPVVVDTIVSNVTDAIEALYALGARDIMVLNMPNLGVAPIVTDQGLKIALDGVAQAHNAKLKTALSVLSGTLPGLRIIPVDVYTFLQSLTVTSSFNFAVPALPPPLSSCLFLPATPEAPPGSSCTDVSTFNVDRRYFFWDIEHPTMAAHAVIGAFLYRELKAAF